jgi:hypothetical protein
MRVADASSPGSCWKDGVVPGSRLDPGAQSSFGSIRDGFLAGTLILGLSGVTVPVGALEAAAGSAESDAAAARGETRRSEARRHFDNGLRLYEDRNFSGALAEFEAAYELLPGQGTLQNIALCKKALYRYAAAADDLEMLLERHGHELGSEAKLNIREAIADLNALVARVVIVVVPAQAQVTVDGRSIGAERERGVRLEVGEHTITVSAPGYATMTRTQRVTAGSEPVIEHFALEPNAGVFSIQAEDSAAIIELDGKPVGRGRWQGPVPPGPRKVRVTRSGHRAFEREFESEAGKTTEILVPKGPRLPPEGPVARPSSPVSPATSSRNQRGWYALGTLSVLAVVDQPRGLRHHGLLGETRVGGIDYGARVGYRVTAPLALELMLTGSRQEVSGVCDAHTADPTYRCGGIHALSRSYAHSTARLGPNLRILTKGDRLRLTAVVGGGMVRHKLRIDAVEPPPSDALPGYQALGWDPYLLFELGAEHSIGHFVVGLDVRASIDTTARFEDLSYRPYDSVLMVGLGPRIGWTEWIPGG